MNDSDKAAPRQRPGAASTEADAESGQLGAGRRQALYALEVMRKRGLIGQADYEARKKAIETE